VIAEDGDNRDVDTSKEFCGQFRLQEGPVVRDITGHDKKIRPTVQSRYMSNDFVGNGCADV
jgi:hypothetical protein